MPRGTQRLMSSLEHRGFPREFFTRLHVEGGGWGRHFTYCGRVGSFDSDDTNESTKDRLRVVVKAAHDRLAATGDKRPPHAVSPQEWQGLVSPADWEDFVERSRLAIP